MTYPCHVPFYQSGPPIAVATDQNEVAALVCTDEDILHHVFSSLPAATRLAAFRIDSKAQLLAILNEWNGRETPDGIITHVILDPGHGVPARHSYSITEFIKKLTVDGSA